MPRDLILENFGMYGDIPYVRAYLFVFIESIAVDKWNVFCTINESTRSIIHISPIVAKVLYSVNTAAELC